MYSRSGIPPDDHYSSRRPRVEYPIHGQARTMFRNLNLSVAEGQFTFAVRRAAASATILRMILGDDQPTNGRILIDGRELAGPDRQRGYVPQKYSLFPDKTVLDNIAFGPEMEEFGLLGRLRRASAAARIAGRSSPGTCGRWDCSIPIRANIRISYRAACSSGSRSRRR